MLLEVKPIVSFKTDYGHADFIIKYPKAVWRYHFDDVGIARRIYERYRRNTGKLIEAIQKYCIKAERIK